MQAEWTVIIAESDLDELGHVNNARYFDHLESARMDWYAKTQLFEQVAERADGDDFGTVVVNINIDFVRECLLGERILIKTGPERLGNKSLALRQIMYKPQGDVAAEAVVTSVVMDLTSRQAVRLPEEVAPFFVTSEK